MSRPRIRFTIGTMMFATAVCAVGLGLGRVHPGLGAGAVLAVLGYPILRVPGKGRWRWPGVDAGRAVFGYVAGVVAPVVCLLSDPIVFVGRPGRGGFGTDFRPFCFAIMGVEIALLIAWFCARGPLGRVAGPIAGAFWVGAAYALGLGLLMIPLSILGTLVAGIGVFGFTPFFTALAFARQARTAAGDARKALGRWSPIAGAALVLAGALVAQLITPT